MLFHAGMIAYARGDLAVSHRYLEQSLSINPHFSILYAEPARLTLEAVRTASTKPMPDEATGGSW
jgi:hypothetical protein